MINSVVKYLNSGYRGRESIRMEAIVAVYSDWGIGDGQTQPVTVRADRLHFRALTKDAAVLFGRKTMEDFPGGKPLKGRKNIVITRQKVDIPDAAVVHTVQEALELAQMFDRCLVIGGASVYEQFFAYLEKVYVTKIDCCPGSVRFFPDLDSDPEWQCTEAGPWLEEDGLRYCFCEYQRI